MASTPQLYCNGIFDSVFGSSIADPYDCLSRSRFGQQFPSSDREFNALANARVDWVETTQAHVFKADLPGMKKEEIQIQVAADGVLSISGERHKEIKYQKDIYRREERSFGKFSRRFRLPWDATLRDTSANLEDGVLTVIVPKTLDETPLFRNVDISS